MLARHAGISSSLTYLGGNRLEDCELRAAWITYSDSVSKRQTEDSESSMFPFVICRILEVEQDYRASGSLRQHHRHC